MTKRNNIKKLLATLIIPLTLSACGSDSGSSSTSSSSNTSSSNISIIGVIVDPFIVGAVLCEDTNSNHTCDTNEQVSTASNATGGFSFDAALTPGTQVIIQTQGKHEGVTYDLDISGTVDNTGQVVISPLTTLETRGLTSAQIAAILNTAATAKSLTLSDGTTPWSITEAQVLGNPMANDIASIKVGSLTESDLSTLQASLATYGLLKIMNGSTTLASLTSVDLYTSATTGDASLIAQEVLSTLTSTLTKQALTDIKTAIDTGRTTLANGLAASPLYDATTAAAKAQSSLPEPSLTLPIKVAVAVIDRLATVGFETCNATVGTDAQKVNAALIAVTNTSATVLPKIPQLGEQFYGMTYQSDMSQLEDVGFGTNVITSLPANLQTGYNDKKAGKVTYRFDTTNTITAL